MIKPPAKVSLKTIVSLSEISARDWDRCSQWAGPAGVVGETDSTRQVDAANPFICHAFLLAMEQSGSIGARTGWSTAHLVAEDEDGCVVGVAPAYLKSHSQGEYVFDHSWADAFQRAGGRYYPKLQVTAPFTPATGRRLLAAPGENALVIEQVLANGILAVRDQMNASSAHITFQPDAEWERMEREHWLRRVDVQYHWFNHSFGTYDDFLATLASRKRKALKRERRDALANDITIDRLTGSNLTEAIWDDFFAFYTDTGSRKWGRPYLTRAFFSLIGQSIADRIVLVMAKRGGRYIAGAINFVGADCLYGRHWGCSEDHPFLHFEVCYHQAIEHAIALGLARVEAGAQGEHKIARGYEPVLTKSSHAIAHPGFKRAVSDFLEHERPHVMEICDAMRADLPFSQAISTST
ncbi:MAG: GNAT family N-acetyltransferase [Bosea sp. (in: a-proteobacteria)]